MCNEKTWPSGEPSVKRMEPLQQIEKEAEAETPENKRMEPLQQIEKEAEAETPENGTNVASKHKCEYCGTKELVFQFPCKDVA